MTLTEAAYFTKRAGYFIGIPAGLIMLIWMIIGLITPNEPLPGKYINPDYMCGPLSTIDIPSLPLSNPAQFNIETTSGAIPDLPEVVNVFKYNHPGQSLLAQQQAELIAERLSFDPTTTTRLSTTEFKWYDPETERTLVIEAGNLNLSMTTDFADENVDTLSQYLPSEENAKIAAMQYLQSVNLLTKDFSRGTQETYLIQITPSGEFREAPSLSEADLVRVDFFRDKDLITIDPELTEAEELGTTLQEQLEEEKIETLMTEDDESLEVKKYTTQVYNDSPHFGNISVYVGGAENDLDYNKSIYKIDYVNWILGSIACGTYQLISPQEAVEKVQNGDGSLVYLRKKDADQIIPYETQSVEQMTILDVSIGYLDTLEKQQYLQPIYVIYGEANFGNAEYGEFYYYVPAIDYESIPDDAGIAPPTTTDEEEVETNWQE